MLVRNTVLSIICSLISTFSFAEIDYLKFKGVHKLVTPQFYDSSPIHGLSGFKNWFPTFRFNGNYGEESKNVPCPPDSVIHHEHKNGFRDNNDCPLDFTAALVQQ